MTRYPSSVPGTLISNARKKWDLTQEELAELWGLTRTHLSRLENSLTLTKSWQLLAHTLDKLGPKAFKK